MNKTRYWKNSFWKLRVAIFATVMTIARSLNFIVKRVYRFAWGGVSNRSRGRLSLNTHQILWKTQTATIATLSRVESTYILSYHLLYHRSRNSSI